MMTRVMITAMMMMMRRRSRDAEGEGGGGGEEEGEEGEGRRLKSNNPNLKDGELYKVVSEVSELYRGLLETGAKTFMEV